MTANDFSVAFHIGAHKTATSHLQRSLILAADALSQAGVRYYGPEHFRLPGRSLSALFGVRSRRGAGRQKREAAEQLALMRKGADRLVLSEENYIGVLFSRRGKKMSVRYPHAETRIEQLAIALGRPIDIYLGVRNPTSYMNSAYCQLIMGGNVMPLNQFKERNPVAGVDWLDFVKRIRGVPGVGRFVVWRHEDYAGVFPQVCAALVGDNRAHLVTPVEDKVNPGLSAAAVAEALHRAPTGGIDNFLYLARTMLSVEDGYPPFDGFSDDQHATSMRDYMAQLAEIRDISGVTLLALPQN